MPTSTDRSILARIVTVLQGINGAGSYTYDVSGTDKVQIGMVPIVPPRVPPCLFVWWQADVNEHGQPVGWYRQTTRWGVGGYVSYSAETPQGHVNAVLDLKADVVRALETDRRLNNLVYDLRLASFEDRSADALDMPPGVALVFGEIETWRERDAASP